MRFAKEIVLGVGLVETEVEVRLLTRRMGGGGAVSRGMETVLAVVV